MSALCNPSTESSNTCWYGPVPAEAEKAARKSGTINEARTKRGIKALHAQYTVSWPLVREGAMSFRRGKCFPYNRELHVQVQTVVLPFIIGRSCQTDPRGRSPACRRLAMVRHRGLPPPRRR